MADITWKRTGSLLRKLFKILVDAPEGLPAAVALAKVAEGEALTEYEAGTYSTGGRRFEIIIRWATVDLVKAGWLVKHKGTCRLRTKGEKPIRLTPILRLSTAKRSSFIANGSKDKRPKFRRRPQACPKSMPMRSKSRTA